MILKIIDQNQNEKITDLDDYDETKLSIGREQSCNIIIDDKKISRIHAYLYKKENQIIIEDNNSSNGIYKNNNRILLKETININECFQIGSAMIYLLNKEDINKKIEIIETYKINIIEEFDKIRQENLIIKDHNQVDIKNYLHRLYEISNNIISHLDLNIVLKLAMESIFEALNIDRGFILLYNEKKELIPSIIKNKFNEISNISISKTVIKLVVNENKVILSNNALSDPRFNQAQSISDNNIRSLMCAPLSVHNEIFGIVEVDSRDLSAKFNESDLELFCGIANQISIGIYNAKLYSNVEKLMNYNENILSNMGSGILVFDKKFNLSKINNIAKNILSINDTFLNKSCLDLSKENNFFKKISEYSLKNKYYKIIEHEFIKDEKNFSIEFDIIPFLNSEKEQEGIIVSFIDTTEIKKLREDIKRKEQLAAIGEMSSFIAHEIRNPLNSIKGFTQVLSKKMPEDTNKKYFDIIIDEVDRINTIVTDLLTFSRDKDLDKEDVKLHEYLDAILVQLDNEIQNKKAQVIRLYSKDIDMISIDKNQFKQVLLNIIQNAIMALNDEAGQLTIATSLKGEFVKIEIKDNGCGIKKEIINKIFEPFFTSKENGTGLGLSICKKIIDKHNGTLSVESQENIGTSFYITLAI